MTTERIVGLHITDDVLYQKYRDGMLPILQSHGGEFGYDFKVSEVLKNAGGKPINRVFTICFKNEETMKSFFSNEAYLEVRAKYYEPSVSATTIISIHER